VKDPQNSDTESFAKTFFSNQKEGGEESSCADLRKLKVPEIAEIAPQVELIKETTKEE